MIFIMVPMGFYCFVFSIPLVELFYQSRNFSTDAIIQAAIYFKLLAVTVFSIGINAMVSRVFIAVQAVKQAFYYQVVLNILLILAISVCTRYYGAYGYPYGIIIINIINYLAMYLICKKLVPQINYAALLPYTGLIILMNGIIAAGVYYTVNYFLLNGILNILVGFLLYLIILLILNKLFKLNAGAIDF